MELTPGSEDAEPVADGGTLAAAQISPTVQLDEIYRTFDADTRQAFQTWMQEQAKGIGDYGRDVNDALGNLAPFAEDTATLVDILNRQEGAVTGLVSNTGVVFEALTERGGQLRSLIENANRVFETTAQRDEELKQAFLALPTFERESAVTFDRLAEFARDTDPLVTQLRPAARQLSPTLRDLGALSPDLEALFRELNPLITASRTGFPAAERVLEDARPLIAQLDPAMRQLTPLLDFVGLYKPELTAFFANTAAATQAKDSSRRPLPAHHQPAEPGEPRRLSAAARRQPAERVRQARATSTSCGAGCRCSRTATAARACPRSPTCQLPARCAARSRPT